MPQPTAQDLLLPDLLALPAMTLATASPAGDAHAAPVYFAASPDLRLYFFSMPGSLHAQHLSANPFSAAAIFPSAIDWQTIYGLQLRGRVEPVTPGPAWQAAWDLYAAKFPFVVTLKAEVTRNTLYAFILNWIRLVDNRRGFGFKQEWTR
jgi:uncharacterized protein YhbP (UPF0306 family)